MTRHRRGTGAAQRDRVSQLCTHRLTPTRSAALRSAALRSTPSSDALPSRLELAVIITDPARASCTRPIRDTRAGADAGRRGRSPDYCATRLVRAKLAASRRNVAKEPGPVPSSRAEPSARRACCVQRVVHVSLSPANVSTLSLSAASTFRRVATADVCCICTSTLYCNHASSPHLRGKGEPLLRTARRRAVTLTLRRCSTPSSLPVCLPPPQLVPSLLFPLSRLLARLLAGDNAQRRSTKRSTARRSENMIMIKYLFQMENFKNKLFNFFQN